VRVTVELPQVGESVVEGIVARWLKEPGELVQMYEPVAEIVTDKVTMELPSPVSGRILRFLVEEGAKVPVGTPLLEIEALSGSESELAGDQEGDRVGRLFEEERPVGPTGGGALPEEVGETAVKGAEDKGASGEGAAAPVEKPWYSPAVRRLAREHGIDLRTISGTGLGGRVTKEDVLAALAQRGVQAEEEHVKVTPIRRLIAENMQRSAREIPQAWAMVEVDVTGLVLYRERIKEEFQKREGVKLTYLPFVLQAVIEGLKRHPHLNARWAEEHIVLRRRIHLGIAVATEQGLLVPVIRDADQLSLTGLARAVHELTQRARQHRLTVEDVQGATFTVNNTGALGVVLSRPLVPPGQAGILTMEAITQRVVISTDRAPHALSTDVEESLSSLVAPTLSVRYCMNMCLSFDHRILDGAEAAAFLRTVKHQLETVAHE
jgi:2-oxoisovalerate dehydrogenase E2 component (dihydrolipoyl transacylase)